MLVGETHAGRIDITESLYNVGSQKSTPAQIRQLILYYCQYQEQADRFMRELTFAKRLYDQFKWDKRRSPPQPFQHGHPTRNTANCETWTVHPKSLDRLRSSVWIFVSGYLQHKYHFVDICTINISLWILVHPLKPNVNLLVMSS